MRHPLAQLYKTKLQLLAVILTVSGVVLLVVVHWIDASHPPHWLTNLPLTDLGSALFTTGLLAVAFEYIDRQDGESRTANSSATSCGPKRRPSATPSTTASPSTLTS